MLWAKKRFSAVRVWMSPRRSSSRPYTAMPGLCQPWASEVNLSLHFLFLIGLRRLLYDTRPTYWVLRLASSPRPSLREHTAQSIQNVGPSVLVVFPERLHLVPAGLGITNVAAGDCESEHLVSTRSRRLDASVNAGASASRRSGSDITAGCGIIEVQVSTHGTANRRVRRSADTAQHHC
jgi:hypothetical protein